MLVNLNLSIAGHIIQGAQEAARAKGVQLRILKAGSEDEIDAALSMPHQLQAGALVVGARRVVLQIGASSLWRWHRA